MMVKFGFHGETIVSINFGAGESSRIQKVFHLAFGTVVVMGILFTTVGLLLPTEIVRLFMDATPEVLDVAPTIIKPYFLTFLFMGMNVLFTYYLQSILKTKMSIIFALLRSLIISGLLLSILPLAMGITGVWCAMPISECTVTVIAICYYRKKHQSLLVKRM